MNFPMLLDAGISGRLCLTLLHSLWQVALLVVVAWVIDRVARKSSVERGYALHVAVLFLALVALPVTYALLPAPVATPIDVATMPVDEFLLPEVSSEPVAAAPLEELPQPPVMIEPPAIVINSESAAATSEPEPTSPGWMTAAPWIVAFYALGVALMLLRLAVGSAKAHALCRRAKPIVDGPLASLLARLVREWSLRTRCRLAESAEVVVPQVIGLVRPTILLPAAAITGLAPRDLEMILVHELAHIRRHDVWVNFVQRLAEAILFFNPGLWYLSRRIGTLREYCCDELACRDMPGNTLPPRVEYATALLNVVELAKPGARKVELGALAASGRGPSELRRRVARLFGEPLREPLRLPRGGVLAAVGMAVVLLVGPAWMGSRAQSPSEESQPKETEQHDPVLRGRVVDEQGEPLPGVKVVLYSGVATRFRGQETMTNDEGKYEFVPLTTGTPIISEEESDELLLQGASEPRRDMNTDGGEQHHASLHMGVVFEHETHVPADGSSWRDIRINLEEGKETVETLDLKMVPGGRVSGIVRHAETGEPMPKLSLRLYNGLGHNEKATYHAYASTDESGTFTSETMFPGRYVIGINDNDFEGDRKYSKIGLVEVKADETTTVELTTRDQPQLQDPFTITGSAHLEDGTLMPYGVMGVRLVKGERLLRSEGGWITGRHGFSLSFGPVERGEVSENSLYGVGTHDIEIYGNNQRTGYRLASRTPSEPLRITDDPTKPEVEDGIRYIRPGVPVEFELVFEKIPAVTIIGDKFVVAPVTTPLERSLLGDVAFPAKEATACVLVNASSFRVGEEIDDKTEEWAKLIDALNLFTPNEGDHICLSIFDGEPNIRQEASRARMRRLERLLTTKTRAAGFSLTRAKHIFRSAPGGDWLGAIEASQHKLKEGIEDDFPLVESEQINVTRVSTFLAHMLADVDCVVEWLPIVRDADGARLMDDVLPAVAESVDKAKTGGGETLLIRLRFSETEKASLERCVNDKAGLKAYASGLGFEHCIVHRSQIAKVEERELAAADEAAEEPNEPDKKDITIIGDKFVVAPVTTALERQLMGNIGRPEDVTTSLFVNNNHFPVDAPIDPEGEEWQELAARLTAAEAKPNEGLYVRLVDSMEDDLPFERRRERHEKLEQVIQGLGKGAGFARVHASQYYGNGRRNDWRNTIEEAQRKVKEDASGGLPLVETEQVRVTLVSTFLAHILVDADCVVDWLPVVRDADGARLMADVLPTVAEEVAKAETGGGETLLIRLRYSETAKEELQRWANDIPGRKAYASGLGFELCNVSQSQIAKEDEEPSKKETEKSTPTGDPDQIAALEELVDSYQQIHDIQEARYRDATGSLTELLTTRMALWTARAELATAKGDSAAAVEHYKRVVEVAEENVAAHKQAYEVGLITIDGMLEANRKRAEAKLALSKAMKRLPNKGAEAETPGVSMLCIEGINLGAESKRVAGAEVHLFQRGESGGYQHFGPYVTDSEGRANCPQAVFYEGDEYDRWFYARLPGKLVGVSRSMRSKRDESPFNPHGVIDMRPSQTLTGQITVPEGFDPTKVHVIAAVGELPYTPAIRDGRTFRSVGEALPEIFDRTPDKEGKFEFSDISMRRRLYLRTEAEGLAEGQWENQDRKLAGAAHLELSREGILFGEVKTPDGKGASGVLVTARIASTEGGAARASAFAATSDDEGRFTIKGLPDWPLVVTVDDPAQKWLCYPQETISVRPGTRQPLTLNFEAGVEVSGRLFDPDEKGVSSARVVAVTPTRFGTRVDEATTDVDGRFSLRLPRGDYALFLADLPRGSAPSESEPFKITVGSEAITDLKFTLRQLRKNVPYAIPIEPEAERDAQRAAEDNKLLVRVVDPDGKPIVGAKVRQNHVHLPPDAGSPEIKNHIYDTDAKGEAVVTWVGESTDLRLWVRAPDYVPLHAMWIKALQQPEVPDEFEFKMSPGTEIGGVVTNESHEPIAGAKVELVDLTASLPADVGPGSRPVRAQWLAEDDSAIITGENGRWSARIAPADDEFSIPPDKSSDIHDLHEAPIRLRVTHSEYEPFSDLNPRIHWGPTLEALRSKEAAVMLTPKGSIPIYR